MSLQNRVGPDGGLFRSAARGSWMGNRGGALHNEAREIVRSYKNQRWITCLLQYKGRKRTVMAPGLYTELFFLDEAVALSAGHRPCAECRRDRFNAFREAWKRWEGDSRRSLRADDMDAELHRKRIGPRGEKVTFKASLASLPDGCFVGIDSGCGLWWKGSLFPWAPDGYREKRNSAGRAEVTVLTPEPIVHCIRQGYVPEVHVSALAL